MGEFKKAIQLGDMKVSLPELLDHMGQSIYVTTQLVTETDPNISYDLWVERLSNLMNMAVVLRGLYEQLYTDWDGYYVRLPIDIGMITIRNPLSDNYTTPPSSDDEGDGVDLGGYPPF
jgi:hypothetical protein